jgi:hypothetical protein
MKGHRTFPHRAAPATSASSTGARRVRVFHRRGPSDAVRTRPYDQQTQELTADEPAEATSS